jgi:hypothetical protein
MHRTRFVSWLVGTGVSQRVWRRPSRFFQRHGQLGHGLSVTMSLRSPEKGAMAMGTKITMGRKFGASLGSALVLAAAIPANAIATIQTYHWMGNIPAHGSRVALTQHNHYYNEMVVNNQGFATGLHEETNCCGWVWVVNGFGTLTYSHPATYYDFPACRNRSAYSFWVEWCLAEW